MSAAVPATAERAGPAAIGPAPSGPSTRLFRSAVPVSRMSQAIPKKKATSPTFVTRNAFFAAGIASGFSNQKPISR